MVLTTRRSVSVVAPAIFASVAASPGGSDKKDAIDSAATTTTNATDSAATTTTNATDSAANGVTSNDCGAYDSSFTIVTKDD